MIYRCGDDILCSLATAFFHQKLYDKINIRLENLLAVTSVVFFCPQSMTNASAGSTTVMRMPCASTWSEATVAPVNQATLAMGQSAKVSVTCCVMPLPIPKQDTRNTVAVDGHDCTFHCNQITSSSVSSLTQTVRTQVI